MPNRLYRAIDELQAEEVRELLDRAREYQQAALNERPAESVRLLEGARDTLAEVIDILSEAHPLPG